MTWFLIVVLALVAVLALLAVLAVLVLAAYVTDETEAERTRIETEVRRAERRLHDVASSGFQQMLDAARGHERR